ncbi:AraC family transcriptional regulator [Nocardia asiatica]|uniref:helix-turn-helix transcriptional regulator n=1 Tax=Nocardia asiatica TaxID=209252 RepID=UPI002454AE25|nr:AraC family transcriptional regulator [Nocardia asiatica]
MSSFDRLSPLLERFRVRAHLLHTGPLCGVTRFGAGEGRGFLHLIRSGELVVEHRAPSGDLRKLVITEPSVLFYPRPLAHDFYNEPTRESDFACATVEFEGGVQHPLARALPPVVVVALAQVDGLDDALDLLFGEIDRHRCGHRVVADRLFEVVLLQLLRWMLDNPESIAMPPGLLTGIADPQLARALIAVHESPGAGWTLETMARHAAMSRSAFAARFREVVGQTPLEYLTGWRLALAQLRLKSGHPLKAIAEELGYANTSALSRVFSQKVGQSPTAWLAGTR